MKGQWRTKDGGPAYPVTYDDGTHDPGMSKWEVYAKAAMKEFLADMLRDYAIDESRMADIAAKSFAMANAMIAESAKEKP